MYMHELYNNTMDVKPTAFSLSRFLLSYCPRRPVSSARFVAPVTEKKCKILKDVNLKTKNDYVGKCIVTHNKALF